MEKVTKAEFDLFVKNYPNELVPHTITICEPPMLTYNDFSNGRKYPEDSIVAKVIGNNLMPGTHTDEYFIERERITNV